MTVKISYLGNDSVIYSHLRSVSDKLISFCNNIDDIDSSSKNFNSDAPHLVFVEQGDFSTDKNLIQSLKLKCPFAYIVLVSDQIKPELFAKYTKYGVKDTIRSDVSRERLLNAIEFIERNHKLLSSVINEQNISGMYEIPLWKRMFDIIFSALALIILFPFLIVIAALIRVESEGPVIYISKRVGSNYRIFNFYKFRSMYKDADKRLKDYLSLNQYNDVDLSAFNIEDDTAKIPLNISVNQETSLYYSDDDVISEEDFIRDKKSKQKNNFLKFENDPRITKMGHFIRKFSIDELPQLVNIIRGDMSIVGNRPLPMYEAEQLTTDQYIDRFIGPAGLTGLWQVQKRGDSGKLSPEERKQLDIFYSSNYNFWMDIKIIFKTLTAFVQKENV
ncbi:sugar transferase [Bacteroidales bacterium MB20-C3-3]|nr:sugar transferase [Bacteroidales bacterium MB20-C3-3]